MKKFLKFTIVLSIIFAMLSGNVAVLAADIVKAANEGEKVTTMSTKGAESQPSSESKSEDSQPSSEPNAEPSEEPETTPSAEPSEEPSTEPSVKPSTEPIAAPSDEPSTSSSANDEKSNLGDRPDPSLLKGSLELKLDLRLPQFDVTASNITVTLTKGSTSIKSTDKATGEASEKQLFYVFNDLEPGEYALDITGYKYQTFPKTNVEIKANTTTQLDFTNGYDASFVYVDGTTKKSMGTGVIRLGDVNGSTGVDEDDQEALIQKIEGTQNVPGYLYDLNNDGNIDILDLSYVVINKNNEHVGAIPRYITNLNNLNISSETTQGSYYKGTTDPAGNPDPTLATDIKEVLSNNDKHVTLQPSDPKKEISEDNAIEIGLDIAENTADTQFINIAPSSNANNNITKGYITVDAYDYKNDQAVELVYEIGNVEGSSPSPEASPATQEADLGVKLIGTYAKNDNGITSDVMPIAASPSPEFIPEETNRKAKIEADGSITVNFGDQIAVKRVVIKVTGTKSNKLADIAKVEFLNGMEDKVPEPQLGIPDLRKQEILDSVTEEGFTVKWNNVPNVTGYKIVVRATIGGKELTETYDPQGHEFEITHFSTDSIKNWMKPAGQDDFTKYYVSVYSVNGEWQSKPSEELEVQPRPTRKPQAITGVEAKGEYKAVKVKWNSDSRASDYFLYCREQGQGEDDWKIVTPTREEEEFVVVDGKVTGDKKPVTKGYNGTSYTVTELNGQPLKNEATTYEFKVTGRNMLGEGDPSIVFSGTTLDTKPVKLPNYKRINTPNEIGQLSNHIKNIWYRQQSSLYSMNDSPMDIDENGSPIKNPTNGNLYSAKGLSDNSFSSYLEVNDWDAGGFYGKDEDKCIVVEFDGTYTMNYITLAKVQWDGSFQHATLQYYDMNDKKNYKVPASLVAARGNKDDGYYTAIKLAKPVTTNRLAIGIGGGGRITVAEMGFYNYDTIEDEIKGLFADDMHMKLSDELKGMSKDEQLKEVQDIEDKLDNPEANEDSNGEVNPESANLKKELNTARTLIEKGDVGKVTKINSTMTSWYDTPSGDNAKDIEFRDGLNGWQPLGVVAREGEEITVYVGNQYKTVGESTRLQLIYTQWRAEADRWQTTLINTLKVGENTITIPKNILTENRERGGSLYINYTGLKEDEPTRYIDRAYNVRVVGGTEIPVLDLSKEETLDEKDYTKATRTGISPEERHTRITNYINELDKVINGSKENNIKSMKERHEEECKNYTSDYSIQEYEDGSDCILTATEIIMDEMMYSVSSKQIWDGLTEKGYTTNEQKIEGLEKSLTAMEDIMELFYKQKGLFPEGTEGVEYKNTFPRTRQNIRCMRMTGNAFMYAGGLHIGIQWNEVKDLAKGVPFTVNEDGSLAETNNGNYFGWGIAHEIGHIINQQAYVHGEVTNNYFSILSQTDNTRDKVRFNYEDVYKKVTSGKTGKAQNVFTQLGLYWQLHLAYDNGGYNYKDFKTPTEQLKNSIYARMDTYARDPSKAPKKTVALEIVKGDTENNLMRLAVAATQKNILDFFEKWGMIPNDGTKAYAEQFDKETKAIQYVNDESRNYVIAKKGEKEGGSLVGKVKLTDAKITNANEQNVIDGNQVKFTFGIPDQYKDGILGYEIVRTYMQKDQEVSRPVAFVEGNETEYTDVVSTINNRVFTYKVVVYDKCLNKVDEKVLEPVKVKHSGQIDKDGWQVTTNAVSTTDTKVKYEDQIKEEEDKKTKPTVDASDGVQVISGISALADNDYNQVFKAETEEPVNEDGSKGQKPDVEITIELPEVKKLVALTYVADQKIDNYEIQVSTDKQRWTTVKSEKPTVASNIANFFSTISGDNKFSGSETLCFTKVDSTGKNEMYNYDYDCAYVKFIIHNSQVAIKELDLLGQAGDNVEFNEIGTNKKEFIYDKDKDYKIPEGAVVLTGNYDGNPAYNAVMLWYQEEGSSEWEIIDGYQVILADDPKSGNLGETKNGSWVYVVEENAMDKDGEYIPNEKNPYFEKLKSGKGKVRFELYRVDDAFTLEGERLVSDTFNLDLTEKILSPIEITDNRTNN